MTENSLYRKSRLGAPTAAEYAAGLRAMADMIQAHPELAVNLDYTQLRRGINVYPYGDNPRATLAEFARAGKAHGAVVTKETLGEDDRYFSVILRWGPVALDVFAERTEVCERVVTGTETVTRMVPDPAVEVPLVEVTEEVERVEWRCSPLLAEAAS